MERQRQGQINWWALVPLLTPNLSPSVLCVTSDSHQVQWHAADCAWQPHYMPYQYFYAAVILPKLSVCDNNFTQDTN